MNISAQAHDEATLATKRAYEHYANARDEATLAVKLDANDEAGVRTPCYAHNEATLGWV